MKWFPAAEGNDGPRLEALIRERLSLIEHFQALHSRLDKRSPAPRSELAADDRVTGWLQLSHQVRSYLNLAADNARALSECSRAGAGWRSRCMRTIR